MEDHIVREYRIEPGIYMKEVYDQEKDDHKRRSQGQYKYIVFLIVLGILAAVRLLPADQKDAGVSVAGSSGLSAEERQSVIAKASNKKKLTVRIDDREYTNRKDGLYLDDSLRVMVPADMIRDAFDCSVHLYDGQDLMVEKREDVLQFHLDEDHYDKNQEKVMREAPFIGGSGGPYISLDTLVEELGYSCQWDKEANTWTVQDLTAGSSVLPHRYDLREKGRAPQVEDQGGQGTCWAFAALSALESSMLPESEALFSADHMDRNNSFADQSEDGGQYAMAMAYLAAWQGPVYEADDPYGDGETDSTLLPVQHVQDMELIEAKDLEGIKKAIFCYGGVESCIYTRTQNIHGFASYYNSSRHAYCYLGEEAPDHDIIIIGWDDDFPKEDFRTVPEGDGAFICQNSWGSSFGDDGVFYVSYYDTNIGVHNLVYTGVEPVSNYDGIYQSDLCGWVGQIGYRDESLYGANVFTARGDEEVAAAGFYTTGADTDYKVFLVPGFTGMDSLDGRILMAEGRIAHAGYHTVRFESSMRMEQGEKFAVVLWLSTPGTIHPMAIEYRADDLTQTVDLEDGEGYISAQGDIWMDAKESFQCNLCIKAYVRAAAR